MRCFGPGRRCAGGFAPAGVGNEGWAPVGSGHVIGPPGGVVMLRIVLAPGAPFKP